MALREATARGGLFGQLAALLVAAAVRRPALTLLLSLVLGIGSCWLLADRFALDTDALRMFRPDLPWRQAEAAIDRAFPQRDGTIAIVIDGETPDAAERAAAALADELTRQTGGIREVIRIDADPALRRAALLFPDLEKLRSATERIIAAQPMLGTLAADPSLRGVAKGLQLAADGILRDEPIALPEQLAEAMRAIATSTEAAVAGRVKPLDWRGMFTGEVPEPLALRRFIQVLPDLDFTGLAPAGVAIQTIRSAIDKLGPLAEGGARVRLTGSPVIRDEEFSTVFGGAVSETLLSLLSVAALLWFGLRSMRLIGPMMIVLVLGLVLTGAFGTVFIGPYNPLSIAFAVLFIGLGVDFAIQYSVCLREQRHRMRSEPLASALVTAGAIAGPGIGLAACALCAGFLAFLPTDYRGLSELGIIAAAGMIIGVVVSLTTLPAILLYTQPREEEQPVGYAALAPLDRWLTVHARRVSWITLLVALLASVSLLWLRFDTNPLNLRNPKTEAVSTFRDLMRHPDTTPNTIQILVPDLAAAAALIPRLEALPEVDSARSLLDFVPKDQPAKLALIEDAADLLGITLSPPIIRPPPDDGETILALREAAATLQRAAAWPNAPVPIGAAARRLALAFETVATAPTVARERLRAAMVPGLATTLDGLRLALAARSTTINDLPAALRRDWISADGQPRVEVRPRDRSDRADQMARFATAVLRVVPSASGPAVSVQASAHTVSIAFLRAGVIATALTVLLLVFALRSWRLAFLALAPLVLAGLLTLATCVIIDLPLNLANIIALPLLFAQGVAFNIYYVAAWRAGERALLPSALTRAVLYSALTNGTAFGTLALSHHPGTAGMGVMLTLSLIYALLAVVMTLPSLLTMFAAHIGRPEG
jgi:hopanoid biosynthesis associated RND transporter like protein HpnN